jgi:hypothetical protein
LQLPPSARVQHRSDRRGLPESDPGVDRVVRENIGWLCRAQDNTRLGDDGVARDFSLIGGWNSSYPETTGYIIPTILDHARRTEDGALRDRARRMLDWLSAIQFDEGGFQGGLVDSEPKVPVTFNTGQILLGLAAGVSEFGDAYQEPMDRAAGWLRDSLDDDGCWRQFPTPFAAPGEKAYETHVSWGLFEAERVAPGNGYGEAGLKNVRWALNAQHPNGWFEKCCLEKPDEPLTHTLGYVLRGLVEAYRLSEERDILNAAVLTADNLLNTIDDDGFIPGRLDCNWRGTVKSACLTGTVQIASSWLMLYRYTGNERYLAAARSANRYVRRTVVVDGPDNVRGGVKGSFPVSGEYCTYEYLSWACKFCIDANVLEAQTVEG